jgi:hypothetical protein
MPSSTPRPNARDDSINNATRARRRAVVWPGWLSRRRALAIAMAEKHKIFPQSFNDVLATSGFNGHGPTGSVRELLARFSGDRRLFDIPEIGVRACSLPILGRTGLSRWLDDCAFSFPVPGIT